MRVLILSLLLVVALPVLAKAADKAQLTIETASGPVHYGIEMAEDDAARERGLMFRVELPPDHGMLFDFHDEQPVAFWMKNTLIPLDMLFIRADGRIANIRERTKPGDLSPQPSDGPVRAVLELAGGQAAARGIHPGDRVRHAIFP